MKALLTKPSTTARLQLLQQASSLPLSYWQRGGTLWQRMPQGYQHDEVATIIGSGPYDWLAAKEALAAMRMFSLPWTNLLVQTPRPASTLPNVGDQMHLVVALAGMYWGNTTRVVYTLAEDDVFGFAYGTLSDHLAQGEELFTVERGKDDVIRYRVRVMSKPYWWGAKLLTKFGRRQQARFRKESAAAMKWYVMRRSEEIERLEFKARQRATHDSQLLV